MRILISDHFIVDLQESSSRKALYGAWVLSNDFYRNLLRYGRFDEYRFFMLPEKDQGLRKELSQSYKDPRIKFYKTTHLPFFLENAENSIFFSSFPQIYNIANLRSIYAKKYFPICGIITTVSYAHLIDSLFFQNMIVDLHKFDTLVCPTRAALEAVKRIYAFIKRDLASKLAVNVDYKARLDCLPFGINSENYQRFSKADARKSLKLPADKTIILYFGRFSVSDKADLYPLFLVFKNLLSKSKNILLVLAGKNCQGDYAARLKRIANNLGIWSNLRFFLNTSLEEKYLLYAAADIFTSPSDNLQESFGLTVIEAMASGLPVVVSDWDGYKEIVIHNQNGFLIPTYWAKCDKEISDTVYLFPGKIHPEHLALGQSVCVDIKKMIECLGLLIKNKNLRIRLGNNARERAKKFYDWSEVIPRYEMLWDGLIEKAKVCQLLLARTPIFYPRYFSCFKHYPSRILGERTNVVTTREGIGLLKKKDFPQGAPLSNLIMPQMILEIIFFLREKGGTNIERIRNHLKGLPMEISAERINYCLMWMLKNYLIKVK